MGTGIWGNEIHGGEQRRYQSLWKEMYFQRYTSHVRVPSIREGEKAVCSMFSRSTRHNGVVEDQIARLDILSGETSSQVDDGLVGYKTNGDSRILLCVLPQGCG